MTQHAVLILADTKINIDEPAELIRDDFPVIHSCTDLKSARALLEAHQPIFLLFNHDNLKTSLQLQQALFPNRQQTPTASPSSILLCQARDVHTAYKLCQKQLFDDYLIFKPLYDPYRLNHTLHTRSKTLAQDDNHAALQHRLAELGQNARKLHHAMEQSIEHSNDARKQAQSAYSALKDSVIKQLHAIPAQLTSSKWQTAINVISPELLKQRFSELTEQRISQQFLHTEAALQHTLEHWSDTVSAEIARGVEFLEDVEIVSKGDDTPDTAPQNKKILIVEDDEIYSSILQSILEEVGYRVFCECEGNKGLKRMAVTQPDYVLLDYELPDMTGLDFLKTVKSSNLLRHIPIIMLTGHNDRELVKKSILGGSKAFIVKPANREIILSKLQAVSSRTADQKD